ncbi:MAG: hypothetical protein COB29_01265 [Sulfitobacter sp.]|nr:MAG: hypothetical protein COB29_01265 [Sulfitobacter sp.]
MSLPEKQKGKNKYEKAKKIEEEVEVINPHGFEDTDDLRDFYEKGFEELTKENPRELAMTEDAAHFQFTEMKKNNEGAIVNMAEINVKLLFESGGKDSRVVGKAGNQPTKKLKRKGDVHVLPRKVHENSPTPKQDGSKISAFRAQLDSGADCCIVTDESLCSRVWYEPGSIGSCGAEGDAKAWNFDMRGDIDFVYQDTQGTGWGRLTMKMSASFLALRTSLMRKECTMSGNTNVKSYNAPLTFMFKRVDRLRLTEMFATASIWLVGLLQKTKNKYKRSKESVMKSTALGQIGRLHLILQLLLMMHYLNSSRKGYPSTISQMLKERGYLRRLRA